MTSVRAAHAPRILTNAGPTLNTTDEYEPLPSPDGQTMILMANDGLYEARANGDALSGEFFVCRIRGPEDWPPACPHK